MSPDPWQFDPDRATRHYAPCAVLTIESDFVSDIEPLRAYHARVHPHKVRRHIARRLVRAVWR